MSTNVYKQLNVCVIRQAIGDVTDKMVYWKQETEKNLSVLFLARVIVQTNNEALFC